MKHEPKNIRLSIAAKMLGCSRNTMHKIANREGMKKFTLSDGKTSPWYLLRTEVEQFQKARTA